jgi:hypothetical protein
MQVTLIDQVRMDKPRIFLGSSGRQAKLLQSLTRGLEDIAHVEPWTAVFNPGTTTLGRLIELTREVDFAAFVFAGDDWTNVGAVSGGPDAGQASPRDNVVFEAGLFGGVLGMRRTFILHANSAKLPTDLLGLTCVRYDAINTAADARAINQKLRNAIESEMRTPRIRGLWWQYALTERSAHERSVLSLLQIKRDGRGALQLTGRAWRENGQLSARYCSESAREGDDGASIVYYWRGERPLDANAPQVEGTRAIALESAERGTGYFTTRTSDDPGFLARTSGLYRRASVQDLAVLDGADQQKRAALIAQRLEDWKAISTV